MLAMVISRSIRWLAGAMEGLGTLWKHLIMSGFTNLGFDGIAVALLGRIRTRCSSSGFFLVL